jgi:cyclohexanone monooxygenase
VGIGQNGLSVNMTSMFDDQARHIAYIISEVRARGAQTVQPTEEAEAAWVAEIRRLAITTNAFIESCTPGYYNNEGTPRAGSAFFGAYTPGINAFNRLLEEWREQGDMVGLELKGTASSPT